MSSTEALTMAKQVAPTKSTGGGGFEFEDKVAAFFMTCLISSRPPLDPGFGSLLRVSFQVRVDGWLLDDVLLVLQGHEYEVRCALSVKSNPQFSKSSAPSEFVKAAWEQYLGEVQSPFKKGQDRFGLVTSPLDSNTKAKLEDLLKKARAQSSIELSSRIKKEEGYVSKEEKRIFESFACPIDLAKKYSINETHIGELLKHFEHRSFDFENTSSSDLSNSIGMLRDRLESNSLQEAENFWKTLCDLAGEMRAAGGSIDLAGLIHRVRRTYKLKDFPDYVPMWKKLKEECRQELDLIRGTIGDSVRLDRHDLTTHLNRELESSRFMVLIGESGSGKTVLQKSLAELCFQMDRLLWVNAENVFEVQAMISPKAIKSVPDKTALLMIDGVDRFYGEEQFRTLALLLLALTIEETPWKIIMSCQPEEWSRVQLFLTKRNVSLDWKVFNVKDPSTTELEGVWKKYPLLRTLSLQRHLNKFVIRPKVLDLLARRISHGAGIDSHKWVGESSLINWYWEEEVQGKADGLARSTALKKLAELMADSLIVQVPETQLSIDEGVIQELVKDRILKYRNDRISFEHDLVADWARLRLVKENHPNVAEYLKNRLVSPLWSRALRLFAVDLLETDDIQEWAALLDSFKEETERGNLGQDLVLEASIFSANSIDNLERSWAELLKNNGVLLGRLLIRFLYSATFPSPMALRFAQKYEEESTATLLTIYRDPYWLYWIPMIKFLHNHMKDALKFSSKQVAEICDKWLRFSKLDWPGRTEAAEMAIELAEDILSLRMSKIAYWDRNGLDHLAFRAALAGCNEATERVMDFALIASGRKKASGRILTLIKNYDKKVKSLQTKESKRRLPDILEINIFKSTEPPPPPWPDGPVHAGDQVFYEVCLEPESQDSLYPIIESLPEKALEIILALLIEHPTPRDRYSYRHKQYTGVINPHKWFPPFFTRGPFYFFLKSHPEKGLDLIIKLMNFATERWSDQWREQQQEPPSVEMEFPWGKKSFIGDPYVYYWHRNVGNVSYVIPSALMALEKWLYEQIERNEDVGLYLETILKECNSMSFIGLMISIGKRKPRYFNYELLPLLSVPEFYTWDAEHIFASERYQMMGWFNQGELMFRLAQDFHSMPHRKMHLNEVVIGLFLSAEPLRKHLEEYREIWKSRVSRTELGTISRDALENLILWFDISNWKTVKNPETGEDAFQFEMPQEVAKKKELALEELEYHQLLLFSPIQFRRVLDGDQKIAAEDATKVWETIQLAARMGVSEKDSDKGLLSRENVISGGIAVLFRHFRAYLKEDPEKERWCINTITDLIQHPPRKESHDHPVSIANWFWDRFCAEVMPLIWLDEPENRLFRRCMAILASNWHYETVEILFRVTSEYRKLLNISYEQLVNFVINFSHTRWKHYREQHLKRRSFNVDKWLQKQIKAFEKGTYPSEQIAWEIIAADEIRKRNDFWNKRKKEDAKVKRPKEDFFDFWLLKAAFSWMPSLDKALDQNERASWLWLWKEALRWTIRILETDEDGEISGTPDDWDRWLFEQVALQLVHSTSEEKPEDLWQPILELGADGHYWVEDFLHEFFRKGLASNLTANFCNRWREMLEYAFLSEEWRGAEGRGWYKWRELWCELLGMSYWLSDSFDVNKKPIVLEMKGYYERWAKNNLVYPESAVMFVKFLTRPAAEVLLKDGLVWLDKAAGNAGENFFRRPHDDVSKSLATLLELSWKKHRLVIKNNSETYSAFKRLLEILVDLQVPEAIQIHNNLL